MKTIELTDETYAALESRVRGFGDTPEMVIKRLLAAEAVAGGKLPAAQAKAVDASPELVALITGREFEHMSGKDRYLYLLTYLYHRAPHTFHKVAGLRLGKRVQIASTPGEIDQSGKSTFPASIPGTPYWALTNLSNRSKRDVLYMAFSKLGHSDADIRVAVQSIPDSGFERSSLKYFGDYDAPPAR